MRAKRFLSMLVIVTMLSSLFAAMASAAAAPPAKLKIKTTTVNLVFDGQQLKLPEGQVAFIYKDRTYVPIRYISYALQKSVKWDHPNWRVLINEPTEEELVELQKQLEAAVDGEAVKQPNKEITVTQSDAKLFFYDEEVQLPEDQHIYLYDSLIYVPLRFLSEAVGLEIGWDQETFTVTGESEAYRAAKEAEGGISELPGGIGGGGSAGGSGGNGAKLTYEQITSNTEKSLTAMRNSCELTLLGYASQYLDATTDTARASIKANANSAFDKCSADFEKLMTDTSAKLTAGGYSTAIIADYRTAFEAQVKAGRAIVEGLK